MNLKIQNQSNNQNTIATFSRTSSLKGIQPSKQLKYQQIYKLKQIQQQRKLSKENISSSPINNTNTNKQVVSKTQDNTITDGLSNPVNVYPSNPLLNMGITSSISNNHPSSPETSITSDFINENYKEANEDQDPVVVRQLKENNKNKSYYDINAMDHPHDNDDRSIIADMIDSTYGKDITIDTLIQKRKSSIHDPNLLSHFNTTTTTENTMNKENLNENNVPLYINKATTMNSSKIHR